MRGGVRERAICLLRGSLIFSSPRSLPNLLRAVAFQTLVPVVKSSMHFNMLVTLGDQTRPQTWAGACLSPGGCAPQQVGAGRLLRALGLAE